MFALSLCKSLTEGNVHCIRATFELQVMCNVRRLSCANHGLLPQQPKPTKLVVLATSESVRYSLGAAPLDIQP